jgi:hypothetical protein
MASIFGVNFDLENFKFKDFLTGCSNEILGKLDLQPKKVKEIAEYRIAICKACPLGQVNGVTCFRDVSNDDYKNINDIANIKFDPVTNNLDFQQLQFNKQQFINDEIKKLTLLRKHTIHEDSDEPIFGCGCLLNCKTSNLGSSCPANKWLAVE